MWSLLGLGWDKLESLFALSGGVCPLASSNFAILNHQISQAVTNLTTVSCADGLQQMQDEGRSDFATDTTYSSRNFHANEATVLISDPVKKTIVARKHLLKHTGESVFMGEIIISNISFRHTIAAAPTSNL